MKSKEEWKKYGFSRQKWNFQRMSERATVLFLPSSPLTIPDHVLPYDLPVKDCFTATFPSYLFPISFPRPISSVAWDCIVCGAGVELGS